LPGLRSLAGAAPGAGEPLVRQSRFAANAEPAVYGDGQPRGLRAGADASNVAEFYSVYGTTLGMRVRHNGVESQASYAFPAGVWSMHDYEIAVTTTSIVFKVDGIVTGTFTTNLPAGALKAYVSTYDGGFGNVPVSIESLSLTLTANQLAQTIEFAGLGNQAFTTAPLSLVATATSGEPVSFSVVSGPAFVSGNQLTLTAPGLVTIQATQAGNATYLPAPTVERSFTVTGNAASWRLAQFTETELNDPGISALTADPDGDGLNNLLEYALGLTPKAPNTAGLPEMGVDGLDWTFTYTRPVDRPDLSYVVQVSTNLVDWTSTGVTHGQTAESNGVQTWQARFLQSSASNLYFRLKISTP